MIFRYLSRPLGILLLALSFSSVNATSLSGVVSDNLGNPLPFANVLIVGSTRGTTTNENGAYQLELAPGQYQIAYMFIGYKRIVLDISVGQEAITRNVSLEVEDIQLQEVVISGKEDPAYPIMRKVIAAREYHYNQVRDYQCQAYIKGLQRIVNAPDKVLGFNVNFDGSLDSNNAGIVYLSESISDFTFKKPDKVREIMISSKVSGKSQSFSWNRAADLVEFDFYKNSFPIEVISDRHFVSPLSDNAMKYYKYKLMGTIDEGGRHIYKIFVSPKGESGPVFKGNIYIVDQEWVLHSLDLMLTKKDANINYVDTLNVHYTYIPVNDTVWMPLSQQYDFTFNILSIQAAGYIIAVYKDHKVNTGVRDKFFTNEVMKVTEESNTRDSVYWDSIRPVPLTTEEVNDYVRKDSLEELKKSKPYLDSLDRKGNIPDVFDLVLGYEYRKRYRKFSVRLIPPIEWVQYNTVEGWNIRLQAAIMKEFDKRRLLRITPTIRYGFSNKHWNGTLQTQYLFNRVKYSSIGVEGGQYVYQFNRDSPISELVNSFYTLFLERNFLKIFEERYVKVSYRTEVVNGLIFWSDISYSHRNHLKNTSSSKMFNFKSRDFSANNPEHPDFSPDDFSNHEAFFLSIALRYQPGVKYISRPDQKIMIESKWPQFFLQYRKAIPGVLGSDLNYDLLAGEILQTVRTGMAGSSRYSIKGGGFINHNRMGFMDYKHFNGNQTVFGMNNFNGFQLLDYYEAATNGSFFEAHYEHHFDGFMLARIPKLNKLKWQLVLGAHYLYTSDFKSYSEFAIGLENIFRVIRADFVNGISNRYGYRWGVRIGITFNNL
ncbi:MAG: DUF5686 and carboxypeptidase regulatory-like domain-containing protein [Chitinophagales bacterium]|nr:DUF5686 and carboxypeptidase regulatory-like domain-containing protein [Chitinophagales bacterium]